MSLRKKITAVLLAVVFVCISVMRNDLAIAFAVYQDKDSRNEYTRTFVLSDSTSAAVAYNEAVCYFNDVKYRETDNTLIEIEFDGSDITSDFIGNMSSDGIWSYIQVNRKKQDKKPCA